MTQIRGEPLGSLASYFCLILDLRVINLPDLSDLPVD